ncbi:MAG: type II secretion system protein M [Deltaproteobacteria bacterium]|nr:type II secretion system protein M [Deltaproteobacteria bacterium]MBW2285406.1 type II secretion system protein M [Deltaproteobacteria bacterium]
MKVLVTAMTLSRREKIMVGSAAALLLAISIVYFAVLPFLDKRDALQRGIRQKERALMEIVALSAEHRAMDGSSNDVRERLKRRAATFTLFSFLESAARETGVKDRIAYMKPSITTGTGPYQESQVEMKLAGVTLKELVTYLHAVESPHHLVSVLRLSIRESGTQDGLLDAVAQFSTLRKT